jgi:hypothetical protein
VTTGGSSVFGIAHRPEAAGPVACRGRHSISAAMPAATVVQHDPVRPAGRAADLWSTGWQRSAPLGRGPRRARRRCRSRIGSDHPCANRRSNQAPPTGSSSARAAKSACPAKQRSRMASAAGVELACRIATRRHAPQEPRAATASKVGREGRGASSVTPLEEAIGGQTFSTVRKNYADAWPAKRALDSQAQCCGLSLPTLTERGKATCAAPNNLTLIPATW